MTQSAEGTLGDCFNIRKKKDLARLTGLDL